MALRPLLLLAALGLQAAWSLCQGGDPGYDGADFNITVTRNYITGCTTQSFVSPLFTIPSLTVCNGTNSAACPSPTITTVGQAAGCGLVSATGSAVFCNGTAGATGSTGSAGLTGLQGAQGACPSVTTLTVGGVNCQLISAATGGFTTICNGTSNTTGATGAQGSQGPQGRNGTVGATGLQGLPGVPGILPNYYVVDGASGQPYTRAGLQSGLNVAAAAGGGVVYLGPCNGSPAQCTGPNLQTLVSDCGAPITIPTGVTLDLGGNTIQMPTGSQPCDALIQAGAASSAPLYFNLPLVANSTEGGRTVTIAANSYTSAGLAAGSVCLLGTGYATGTIPSGTSVQILQIVRVASFVNSTGVITLRESLVGTFGPAPSLAGVITCYPAVNTGIELRNGYLSYGSNTNINSLILSTQTAVNLKVHDISIIGPGPSGVNNPAMVLDYILDSRFENLVFNDLGGDQAAISSNVATGLLFRDIKVFGGSTGLQLIDTYWSDASAIVVNQMTGIGIDLQTSGFNTFSNLVSNGAALRGLRFKLSSFHNTFRGVQLTGSAGYGIEFAGTGDSFNQLHGVENRGNLAGPLLFGNGAIGNYLEGDNQGTPVNTGTNGLVDLTMNNMVRQTVTSVNGFLAVSMHNTTTSATDFAATRMVIIGAPVDNSVTFSMKGSDGIVRRGSVGLS